MSTLTFRATTAATRHSLARRAILPPPPGPAPSAERVRLLAWSRVVATLSATFGNASIFLLLRDAPGIRPDVIWLGLTVNVSLLLLDVAITLAWLRTHGPHYTLIFRGTILLEVAAGLLWLQLTGTVSSYYIGAGLLITLLYRLGVDYPTGLFVGCATLLGHFGMFALEEAGVLSVASLFVAEPLGLYAESTFRWAAMWSMTWLYGAAFCAANFAASLLAERAIAVDVAEHALQRARDEARPGRLAGRQLDGRYDLGDVLGRGGMGEVYQAIDRSTGQPVAVKVLHAHMTRSGEARERFRREAQLAARVPAGHVPALLDVGATDGGLQYGGLQYLVMELVRGEDLAAVLRRRGALPPDEVAVLVARIATALDAIHDAGIVHRDLKPANIVLVDGKLDDVRLLDLGIARLLEPDDDDAPLTRALAVIGTAGYLAPEQAHAGLGPIGPHTDVFALGAIAYRALTGVAAFPSRDVGAAIDEALRHHPPPPSTRDPELPPQLDDVLAIALAKPPALRYARASELSADLATAIAGTLPPAVTERARTLPGHRATAPFGGDERP